MRVARNGQEPSPSQSRLLGLFSSSSKVFGDGSSVVLPASEESKPEQDERRPQRTSSLAGVGAMMSRFRHARKASRNLTGKFKRMVSQKSIIRSDTMTSHQSSLSWALSSPDKTLENEDPQLRTFAVDVYKTSGIAMLETEFMRQLQDSMGGLEHEVEAFRDQVVRSCFKTLGEKLQEVDSIKKQGEKAKEQAEIIKQNAELTEKQCRAMQADYLKEVTALRDKLRRFPDAPDDAELLVSFFDPLRYLDQDCRDLVVSCVGERVRQIIAEAQAGSADSDLRRLVNDWLAAERAEYADAIMASERKSASALEHNKVLAGRVSELESSLKATSGDLDARLSELRAAREACDQCSNFEAPRVLKPLHGC